MQQYTYLNTIHNMCVLCKDHSIRSYTHSRNMIHRRALFKIMKKKMISGFYEL